MNTPPNPQDTTHFGFRGVPVAQKQKLVAEVFSSVAGNYDLMNDAMSLGIHRLWKKFFVATCQVRKGDRVLDLAGGTGDIAALLKGRVGEAGALVLGDINGDMLRVGRDRMTNRGHVRGFEYVQCNAQTLPFPDASFDLVTMAFEMCIRDRGWAASSGALPMNWTTPKSTSAHFNQSTPANLPPSTNSCNPCCSGRFRGRCSAHSAASTGGHVPALTRS